MPVFIQKLAVLGVGLIGGSVALALKQAGAVGEVVGYGRSQANLDNACSLGVIDHIATNLAAAVQGADAILLAVPVGQMAALMQAIAPYLDVDTLVTDAGSTKQDVAALMTQHLSAHLPNCVPAHPIAGAEASGASAARADLFVGKNVVLTPLSATSSAAVARVSALWQVCGAKLSNMTAVEHDAVFAAVSHLPHLLAYALVDMLVQRENAETLFNFAASGFRDFTRIAASSPEMWRDIALANRDALLAELAHYQTHLQHLQAALSAADGAALEAVFRRAQAARAPWLAA